MDEKETVINIFFFLLTNSLMGIEAGTGSSGTTEDVFRLASLQ